MASKKWVAERVQAFVAAMVEERGPREREHIDDIERDMEELADAVADEFASQLLARQAEAIPVAAACPDCGRASQPVGERRRELMTTRGTAPLKEPKHYCPACRRHFFPSVGSVRPRA